MRRLVAWIGGAVGGVTAYRLLRRRSPVAPATSPEPAPTAPAGPDERVDELRAKLAETRSGEPVVEEAPPPVEDAVDEAPDSEESEPPEDRRRRVHEEGRAALDDMQSE